MLTESISELDPKRENITSKECLNGNIELWSLKLSSQSLKHRRLLWRPPGNALIVRWGQLYPHLELVTLQCRFRNWKQF
jgi:hypothetical protein